MEEGALTFIAGCEDKATGLGWRGESGPVTLLCLLVGLVLVTEAFCDPGVVGSRVAC